MNHYVNGITNVSMSGGVITFDFVSASVNDKGETKIKDEVQISMNGTTFNGFMQICSDFIDKVKESNQSQEKQKNVTKTKEKQKNGNNTK